MIYSLTGKAKLPPWCNRLKKKKKLRSKETDSNKESSNLDAGRSRRPFYNIALKRVSIHFTPRQEDSIFPSIYLNKSSFKLWVKERSPLNVHEIH